MRWSASAGALGRKARAKISGVTPKLVFRENGVAKPENSKTGTIKETEVEQEWIHIARSQSFKTVFLGDSNVGKTCLARLFVERRVVEQSTNTIGFDYHVREVELEQGIPIKLQIWDTAGMEQFRNTLITKYYRNADGIVLVFDITKRESFESIVRWIGEVRQYCGGLEVVKLALVGNKTDQQHSRVVPQDEALALASRYGMSYTELSAKRIQDLTKLEELFTNMARDMFGERERKELTQSTSEVIRLGSPSEDWVVVTAPEQPPSSQHNNCRSLPARPKCNMC